METPQSPKPSVFREAHLRDYWKIVWQGRWTVLAIFAVILTGTVVWTFLQTPVYRATATVEIQPKARGVLTSQDATGLGAAGYGWLAEEKYHNTQVEIIRSRDVAQRVVRMLNLQSHPQFAKASDPVAAFRSMLNVEGRRETGLIAVSINGSDRNEITQWVNAVAQAYVDRNFDRASENVAKAVSTISNQIAKLQTELSEAEEERIDTLETTKIYNSESQEATSRERLQKYHAKLADVQMELRQVEDRLQQIREMQVAKVDVVALNELGEDVTLRDLLQKRAEAEKEFESIRVDFKPNHPSYEKAENQLASVNGRIQDRVALILAGIHKQHGLLLQQASFLQDQIRDAEDYSLELAKATSRYDIVKSDAETKKRVFDLITKTMNEVTLGAELMSNNVSVLDQATPPLAPIKPRKRVNLAMGAMLGLFLGLGAVFFLDYLDNTIRTPEDIEKYLGLSVLSVIPKTEQGLASRAVREAFQSLRTSIIFSSKNRQRKLLLITSTGPQEGKSTSVANLGRTLAAAGDSVAIIDCDMRRPTQHLQHQLERDHGLTNYLAAPPEDMNWAIYAKATATPNLHIFTCGPIPPNPPELLGNDRFMELLTGLRERYDWVLMDSPPASSLADASLLASLADMVVLVVQHNRTDRDLAVKTLQALQTVNATVAGVVLNNVDLERTYQKDYYYAGYYYYTEDEAKEKSRKRVERKAQAG